MSKQTIRKALETALWSCVEASRTLHVGALTWLWNYLNYFIGGIDNVSAVATISMPPILQRKGTLIWRSLWPGTPSGCGQCARIDTRSRTTAKPPSATSPKAPRCPSLVDDVVQ